MYSYEVDDKGFIINNYYNEGDAVIPEGCITVQLPQPLPFYKPRWDGSAWVEGATQEEIDELTKPEPMTPSQEERLAELEQVVNMMLMGEM